MDTFNIQAVTTCIFLNVDRLHAIIHQLKSDELQLKTAKYVLLAKRLKKSGDFIRKYYYGLLSFILLVQPALKLLRKDKEPFYATYIPPALGQMGMLVFQEVMTAIAGYAGCYNVILDVNLMIVIRIQIEILKDILNELDDINVTFECIKRYEQIMRLVKNVQHILRVGMSISFFTGALLFCTTLFKILETEVNFSELMFVLPYTLGMIFILLIHCWYGNDIIYRVS
nr:unnamed protein product [Callosobruchus chinensis]